MIAIALLLAVTPQTEIPMNVQIDRVYRAADAALNTQYRATMAVMAANDASRNADLKKGLRKPDGNPTYQAALLAAQRAWLAYRDAQCRAAGFAYRGGTMEDLADGQCATALTKARTTELQQLQKSFDQ